MPLLGPPPKATSVAVSRSMKGNRAKDTGPELALRATLKRYGLRGYRANWRRAPGRPDIAFPRKKVAVFLNGCFWHRCPFCRPQLPKKNRPFWKRKFELNRARDARKTKELKSAGWKVYTVWECFLTRRAKKLDSILKDVSSAYRKAMTVGKPLLLTDVRS